MKKKYIILGIILVILISLIFVLSYNIKHKSNEINKKNLNIQQDIKSDTDLPKDSIIKNNEIQTEQNSEIDSPIRENNNIQSNKQIPKDEEASKKENKPIEQEPKEQPKEEVENNSTVDPEYEKLLDLVEYQTHEDCLNAGIDYQLKNIVEITNTMCQTIGYNNRLLGYKLTLWCGNETCNNYKN